MAGNLKGAWEKWERAREHYEALAEEIARLIPRDSRYNPVYAYSVPVQAEHVGREYRFYADAGPPLDGTRCALILGDALFNLRSALDHIVFQLHLRRYKGRIPSDVERVSAFPILGKRRKTPTSHWREIQCLSFKQRRAIEFLQPYYTRHDHLVEVRRALAELNTLNNIDKHRHLHVIRAGVVMVSVPDFRGYGRHESFMRSLEGKTEVFRWTFTSIPPDIAQQVQRYNHVVAQVRLDEPGFEALPLPFLEAYINRIEILIGRFETFFR